MEIKEEITVLILTRKLLRINESTYIEKKIRSKSFSFVYAAYKIKHPLHYAY